MKRTALRMTLTGLLLVGTMTLGALAMTGNGTSDDPYVIGNAADFALFAEKVNAGDADYTDAAYVLDGSVCFDGVTFIPVGTAENPFAGTFDGCGYTLNDITYTGDTSACGVFAYARNAVIRDVSVVNADFTLTDTADALYAGILCGSYTEDASADRVSFEKCYVSGKLTVTGGKGKTVNAGGIVGKMLAEKKNSAVRLTDCYADVSIDAKDGSNVYAGGIAGYAGTSVYGADVKIARVWTKGTVGADAVSNAYAGGLVGLLKAEEDGWGEWLADEAALSVDDGAIMNAFSLCETEANAAITAYTSYTVAQTIGGPSGFGLYCTAKDATFGGIYGTVTDASDFGNEDFLEALGFDFDTVWMIDEAADLPVLRRKASVALGSVSYVSGKLTVHADVNAVNGTLYIAAYDADGRLLCFASSAAEGDTDANEELSAAAKPAVVKAFVLTDAASPICENAVITLA